MEDISKYLDNLFAQLPNTPEARHAREELGQMMEDRYAELCAKGMGEKDAASAAIAEFGSLEEVRESLGLGTQPAAAQPAAAQPACQRPAVASAPAAQAAPPRPQGTSGPVPPRVEQPPQPGSASPNKCHNRGRRALLVTCIVVVAVAVAVVAWNRVSAGIRGAFGDGAPIGQSASSGASGKVEKDVDASFDSVDVDVDMADVVVRAGDSAHVSCTDAKEFSYACDVKGGVLTVTQEARHEHVRGTGVKVVVTVPRGASLRRVTAECEMGDVTISGVRATTTDLEAEMGDITVANCDLADASLDLSCEMGDVTLNGKSMGSSYATHGSGNSGSRTLKATTEMGDITVGN
ncbi:DUF4097 family beta strand repeat-containing protein [Parafannyhessea umbonata]|uniref:DUF4097 family beta strand repeat-containing protein n=1 Tax=Parafannyhessea umbonata TaxID=604330 RepID=UPI0026EFDC06|nr:DUF4097 family beta strand repeat-containing protein [Parafannyhessea umbonata]MDD7199463.1 DUF4097 family beta strand repeat-containing protein [Parafannyhessea umbonata]